MIERINALLNAHYIELLEQENEFTGTIFKLRKMYLLLSKDKSYILSAEEMNYIEQLESHIKNIDPRTQIVTIDGEDVPVRFYTFVELDEQPDDGKDFVY